MPPKEVKEATAKTSESPSPDPGSKRTTTDTADSPSKKPKKASNSTVEWLLGSEAFDLAFPTLPEGHGEIDWDPASRRKVPPAEDAGKQSDKEADTKSLENEDGDGDTKLLTYPDSRLTPFQNLVAALILSKPLSHRLGIRTITTLLNPPFSMRTLEDIDEAGFEGRRKVMWEARTQHKEKTATQLGDLVEGVREVNCGDADLEGLKGLRKEIKGLGTKEAQMKVEEMLTGAIKGVGPTGAGIFLRRVQGEWHEVFPFADARATDAALEFELLEKNGDKPPQAALNLAKLVDQDRDKLVRLLDVLVGLSLEKKIDEGRRLAGIAPEK